MIQRQKFENDHVADFDVIENSMMSLSVVLKKRGQFPTELETDFHIFCQKMRDIFLANPSRFTLDDVYAELPKNKWKTIYARYAKHLL